MQGLHGHASRVAANELPQALAHFMGGAAVVGQHHDFFGLHHLLAQQPGHPVDDDPGFARTGASQHQEAVVRRGGDDLLLCGIGQIQVNAPVCVFGRGQLQHRFAAAEITFGKRLPLQAEVVLHKAQGGLHVLQRQLGVFGHDVDLHRLVPVVQAQQGVVHEGKLAPTGMGVQVDAHG